MKRLLSQPFFHISGVADGDALGIVLPGRVVGLGAALLPLSPGVMMPSRSFTAPSPISGVGNVTGEAEITGDALGSR